MRITQTGEASSLWPCSLSRVRPLFLGKLADIQLKLRPRSHCRVPLLVNDSKVHRPPHSCISSLRPRPPSAQRQGQSPQNFFPVQLCDCTIRLSPVLARNPSNRTPRGPGWHYWSQWVRANVKLDHLLILLPQNHSY